MTQLIDVVAFAYICAYPLIAHKRLVDYSTSPNIPPGPITGTVNTFNNARERQFYRRCPG